MTAINYTTNSDLRNGSVPHLPIAVQIELQGFPENVEAIATLMRQQTEVLEESRDIQSAGVRQVRRRLVVKEIPDLTPTIPSGQSGQG